MRKFEAIATKEYMAENKGVEYKIEEDLYYNSVRVTARSLHDRDVVVTRLVDGHMLKYELDSNYGFRVIRDLTDHLSRELIKRAPNSHLRTSSYEYSNNFDFELDDITNYGQLKKTLADKKPDPPLEGENVGIF